MQTETGDTRRPVSANIAGLSPGTRYHCRIVAYNAGGTAYGSDRTSPHNIHINPNGECARGGGQTFNAGTPQRSAATEDV